MIKIALLALIAAVSAPAAAATYTVDATDSLYPGADGSTPAVAVPVGGIPSLTFASSGSISYNGGGNYNDPDGIGAASALGVSASGGLSGISADHAGFLAGVFESAAGPDAANPPASLNFGSSGSGTAFATLSPLLNQVFFIGDGRTGDGTGATQTFFTPAGATSLHLGFADAAGYFGAPGSYGDNLGALTVNVAAITAVPEPATWAMFIGGFGVLGGVMRSRRRTAPVFA